MVDNTSEAGRKAVRREQQAAAARETSTLGPGTAGYTTSGAAYRGNEVASLTGQPSPADPGFATDGTGLGYVAEKNPLSDFPPTGPNRPSKDQT